jgi:multidrug resistance protein, MATE family
VAAAAPQPASPDERLGFATNARRIAALAWPVFIGAVAVLGFNTIDTLLIARHSVTDLAAFAIGASAYITVFIGMMGVVLALGPIVGQLFGAGRVAAAGEQLHQAVWLALGASVLGCALLVFPQPFIALAQAGPEVVARLRPHLLALACALPAALLFAAYRGFNTAVSRPKAVMVLQLGGLALKLPLSALLIFGIDLPLTLPGLGTVRLTLPALGVLGCGLSTAVAMWAQLAVAVWQLRRDPFYERFSLWSSSTESTPHTAAGGAATATVSTARPWRLRPPDRRALAAQLRLGLPIGLGMLVEVSGFSFMALFIARLGSTAVAGHQITANLAALLFMAPLALGQASSTLAAQHIGAGQLAQARRLGRHALSLALLTAAGVGGAVMLGRTALAGLYTQDAAVLAAALPLLAWLGVFHVFDALQINAAYLLRAWRVATLPLLIYTACIWGVGLGGGYGLALASWGDTAALAGAGAAPATALPAGLTALRGPPGFWAAATLGLALAGMALTLLWLRVARQGEHAARATPPRPPA